MLDSAARPCEGATHVGPALAGAGPTRSRRTPVNPLTLDGERYLVAPRGNTQWVRNLRARSEGRLLVGRRAESFTASEVPEEGREAILRAYLKRWKWEVGAFFDGVGADSTQDELRRIAPDHPVFRIQRPVG